MTGYDGEMQGQRRGQRRGRVLGGQHQGNINDGDINGIQPNPYTETLFRSTFELAPEPTPEPTPALKET